MRCTLLTCLPASLAMLLFLPSCNSHEAVTSQLDSSIDQLDALSFRQIDGLGNPLPDADIHLRISDSGVITVAAAQPDSSLFIEVAMDEDAPGLPQLSLSEGLADSAILLVQLLAVDRLQIGLSMVGEAKLPLNQPLLVINPAGSDNPPLRMASVTPNTPVANLAFNPTFPNRLEWTYYNNGDYDQNGQVTIGDITPLGVHFGKNSGNPDWSIARVADGDLNGVNTISDLTPIGINFGSSVQSFEIHDSVNESGPFAAFPGGTLPFASASQPPGGGPIPFQMDLQFPTYKHYFMLRASDESQLADQQSNVVQYEPANQPPIVVASHDALPLNPPGVHVIFDASGSSDADGTITGYHWDYEGDGNFIDGGMSASQSWMYTDAGSFSPALRVFDNGGSSTQFTFEPVNVGLGTTQLIAIDNSGEVISGLSAALNINDQQVVLWSIESGGQYSSRRCRSTSSAAQNFTVNDTGLLVADPFLHYSLLLSPVDFEKFVFYDGNVIVFRDANKTGDNFTIGGAVRDSNLTYEFGEWVSAAAIGNLGAAVYASGKLSGGYGEIEFSYYEMGWFHRTASTTEGYKPSLTVVSGNPGFCYSAIIADDNHELYFNRASNAIGSAWPSEVVIITGEDVETAKHSILSSFGVVLIVYWSDMDDALRAVTSLDSGLAWGSPVTIDDNCDADDRYVLTVVNDLPCVAYVKGSEIRLCYQSDFLLNTWADPILADDPGVDLGRLEMLDREGWPMVYYIDLTNGNLNALRFGP